MKKLYLAGKMGGLSFEEQVGWRDEIRRVLSLSDFKCVVPCDYYNYFMDVQKSEREVMDWELYQVKDSDLMIVNLKGIESSPGTLIEMATAHDRGIPIIALDDGEEHHPWVNEMIWRKESEFDDLCWYVRNYFF